MRLAIGTDHAGFELKSKILKHLETKGMEVVDCGAFTYDSEDDYPDFIFPVAEGVSKGVYEMGIILGGSGYGEAMVANRVSGVRAAVYNSDNQELIRLTREHNDANILSIGARFINEEKILEAVDLFLDTPFSGVDRHVRRIKKIDITL